MSQQLRAKAVTRVRATPAVGADETDVELAYTTVKQVGKGAFGVVYSAKLVDSADMVAIKKVLQDKRFKSRELQIMRQVQHQNIVRLKYFFYSDGDEGELYLNLIMEHIAETVDDVARRYKKDRQPIPAIYIKLYMYQLLRALAYIHELGICHRDVKPRNVLVDPDSALLKLCDFGLAKRLVPGEPNNFKIGTRIYRALELCLCATDYTTKIDVWSAGCVLAELLLGHPIFPGEPPWQLIKICQVRGTPTKAQMQEVQPNYIAALRQAPVRSWAEIFRDVDAPHEAVDLVSRLLEYVPNKRPSPLQACAHAFFDQLRTAACRLPNGRRLPPLFNFTEQELLIEPSLNATLVPAHAGEAAASDDDEVSAAQPSTTTADDDDDGAGATDVTRASTGAPTQRTTPPP